MTPFIASELSVETEGPMVRVELTADRETDGLWFAWEVQLVGDLGARLRSDPRVVEGGLRVDAGCSLARCTLALDGLAAAMPGGIDALDAVMGAPLPPLTFAQRAAMRREWRHAWRAPSRVFDAALRAVGDRSLPPLYATKPVFPLFHRPPRPPDGLLHWNGLVVAGDLEDLRPRLSILVAHREAAVDPGFCGTATHNEPAALPAPPPVPTITLVDAPAETRATIGLAWLSYPGDTVRDALLAGDFESILVQRLRERDTLTYDVTPEYGPAGNETASWATWAGASFQVALEATPRALAAAREELAAVQSAAKPDVAGAQRRLQGRYAALADTLAGRLALRHLPPPPSGPPPPLAEAGLLGIVVMGPKEKLLPLLGGTAVPVTVTDACTILYGHDCPP